MLRRAIVSFRDKILTWDAVRAWRTQAREARRTVVATNGCFDLLHVGHASYLEAARTLGDLLLVGVNGDASVQSLKGPGRPINSEDDRAALVAALEAVSAVCIFPERDAVRFLAEAQPDVYVKGGDYQIDTLNSDERAAVENAGGRIVIIPFVPGKSTSGLLRRLSDPRAAAEA